ncbi:MAG: DVU0298 family protein [Dissulfurispiraceae bacterium]
MSKYPPECPFCKRTIDRPDNRRTDFGEILSGTCKCGAVYVCDPTGHNTGEAYMEALAVMRGNWDIQLLQPDLDYQVSDMEYDLKSHSRIYNKGHAVMAGKLVFVKETPVSNLDSPLADIGQPLIQDMAAGPQERGMKLKKTIRNRLESKSFEDIKALFSQDKGVLRMLISLSYDKEDIVTWRAIEALGAITSDISDEQIGIIRDTVRRLIWSMTDECGAIGWSAPEILGEIIRNKPDVFSDIIPIVWSFREEGLFKASALWAMMRIAEIRPDLVNFILKDLPGMFRDSDPQVRGYAVWVSGKLNYSPSLEDIRVLLRDESIVKYYENGEFAQRTVRELAQTIVDKDIK